MLGLHWCLHGARARSPPPALPPPRRASSNSTVPVGCPGAAALTQVSASTMYTLRWWTCALCALGCAWIALHIQCFDLTWFWVSLRSPRMKPQRIPRHYCIFTEKSLCIQQLLFLLYLLTDFHVGHHMFVRSPPFQPPIFLTDEEMKQKGKAVCPGWDHRSADKVRVVSRPAQAQFYIHCPTSDSPRPVWINGQLQMFWYSIPPFHYFRLQSPEEGRGVRQIYGIILCCTAQMPFYRALSVPNSLLQ